MRDGNKQPQIGDQEIACCDCSDFFIFTVGEQAFYQDRQLLPPRRCKRCRATRRQAQGG